MTPGPSTSAPLTNLDYPIHQTTLDNGLRVVVSPDHGVPSVAVNLWYDVGSRHEEIGRTGFAHLFEHVMFQGSANVGSGQHIAIMQSAGAAVNATTWFDRTNYFETLPAGGLDLALWLEADRMATLKAALTQENLDNQREVVKEEKRQRYDNVPYGDVMARLVELTFPAGHPYAHTTIGSMADLDAASLDDVGTFFGRYYLPNNAVLSLVGPVDAETGFAKADHFFGAIPRGRQPAEPDATPLPPIHGLPRTETRADVPADAVYLTWRLPGNSDPAFDALDLAFSVLGQGQTSRLYRALVRTAEVAETAGASAMGLVGGTSFGFAYARARQGVAVDRLEEMIITEIDRLAADGPTDAELRRAKAQFERGWLTELSRVDSRADQLSAHATLFDDPTMINTRIAEITAIDAGLIAAQLQTWFSADQRATLVYRKESGVTR
ncbi:MAG: M16 family metallopeptidase [Propionibacteriaceae bacterium]